MTADDLILGLDAGGTGTRCVLATTSGRIIARGSAGGANFRSATDPVGNLTVALRTALAEVPGAAARVRGGCFGLAGAGPAGHAWASALATQAWSAAGLSGRPLVVSDIETAFAAATAARSGALLIAGTGAVAARFEDGRPVRQSDGRGWLFGDEGGGAWLGLAALRAVLAAIDGRGPETALVPVLSAAVLPPDATTGSGDGLAQALVAALYPPDPPRVAALAPLVDAAARDGDPVAAGITAEAARRLYATLSAVLDPAVAQPVVLAGSLLTNPTTVAAGLRAALAAGHPDCGLPPAGDAPAGAVALALRAVAGEKADLAHRRLVGG